MACCVDVADFVYRKPRGRKHKRYGRADLSKLVYKHLRRHVPVYAIELERLRMLWPQLVTPRVAKRTYPARLFKGTLWVHVHDNQWLHELGYLRQEILDRLHREPGFRNIEKIELRLGKIPPTAPPVGRSAASSPRDAKTRPAPPSPLSSTTPQGTHAALAAVRDPALRAALEAARSSLGGAGDPPRADEPSPDDTK